MTAGAIIDILEQYHPTQEVRILWADDENQLLWYPVHQCVIGAERLFLTDLDSFQIYRHGETEKEKKGKDDEENALPAGQIVGILQQFEREQIIEFALMTPDDPTEIISLSLEHSLFRDNILYFVDDYALQAATRPLHLLNERKLLAPPQDNSSSTETASCGTTENSGRNI